MSKKNVFILRNDAKKIFKKDTYDRKSPLQFTFTINQLKALASWASPTGKSKGYLRSPFIPADKEQSSYKAELRNRLVEFLNGDVAKQVPNNKLIDIRYLMDGKVIQAFETLLMWAGYYKIGQAPTKGELKDLIGKFTLLKEKYPPIDLTNEVSLKQQSAINNLLQQAQKEITNGSSDNNTGVLDINTFYALKQEVSRLSNINVMKQQWKNYQHQAKVKKQQAEELEKRKKEKRKQEEKREEQEKEKEKEEFENLKEEIDQRQKAEKEKKEAEEKEYGADIEANKARIEAQAIRQHRNINIPNPIEVIPDKDFGVQVTLPTEVSN